MQKYHEKYDAFIAAYFENDTFTKEIDRVSAMLREYVANDPTAFYTVEEFDTAVATLKNFCLLRAESIRGQLSGTIPSTTEGQQAATTLIDGSSINVSDMGSQGGKGQEKGQRDNKINTNK